MNLNQNVTANNSVLFRCYSLDYNILRSIFRLLWTRLSITINSIIYTINIEINIYIYRKML